MLFPKMILFCSISVLTIAGCQKKTADIYTDKMYGDFNAISHLSNLQFCISPTGHSTSKKYQIKNLPEQFGFGPEDLYEVSEQSLNESKNSNSNEIKNIKVLVGRLKGELYTNDQLQVVGASYEKKDLFVYYVKLVQNNQIESSPAEATAIFSLPLNKIPTSVKTIEFRFIHCYYGWDDRYHELKTRVLTDCRFDIYR